MNVTRDGKTLIILSTRGVEYARVAQWVRAHRLYDTLMGGIDTLWRRDREVSPTGDDYLALVARLRATQLSTDGGLTFAGGHRPGEERLAECHRAARAAAGVILEELAAAIEADQAAWINQFGPRPDLSGLINYYTRSWRMSA